VTNGDIARHPARDKKERLPDLCAGSALAKGGPLKLATVTGSLPTPRAEVAVQHAFQCARIAADNKGRDVVVLDMRGITPLYDFFVLATGNSRRQNHTLAEEIDAGMAAEGETRLSIEGYDAGRWVVQDYGDIVVHVFDQESRSYYGLDDLWADAKHLDWESD
jgi:ribosome-associated protein